MLCTVLILVLNVQYSIIQSCSLQKEKSLMRKQVFLGQFMQVGSGFFFFFSVLYLFQCCTVYILYCNIKLQLSKKRKFNRHIGVFRVGYVGQVRLFCRSAVFMLSNSFQCYVQQLPYVELTWQSCSHQKRRKFNSKTCVFRVGYLGQVSVFVRFCSFNALYILILVLRYIPYVLQSCIL